MCQMLLQAEDKILLSTVLTDAFNSGCRCLQQNISDCITTSVVSLPAGWDQNMRMSSTSGTLRASKEVQQ